MAEAAANSPSSPQRLQRMTDPELEKVFAQFDADGDGKISLSELSQVLSALGSKSSSADLRLAMEEIDSDRDGFISLSEFAALCRSSSSSSSSSSTNEADLRDAFCLYDQDRNGLISVSELHKVMTRLNMKCSLEDCERMVKSVDSDGDGNVNFEEFKKMMTATINK
ncbi:probable calcium-binding protein CML27 [Punica granatum]|uniref:Uncharacterized protein n=2 Tax=Punica granatum TaxID=22663 RepID=A0A2I0LAV8_PUNGR|nr:probable calcium-binding protein CML27 [Punica granatum]PKI77817.1 hypothetical protein CRG98_001781 [Punica granatum]